MIIGIFLCTENREGTGERFYMFFIQNYLRGWSYYSYFLQSNQVQPRETRQEARAVIQEAGL